MPSSNEQSPNKKKKWLWLTAGFLSSVVLVVGFVYLGHVLGLSGIKAPRGELERIAVTGVGFGSVDLELAILVENPNGFQLDLARVQYEGESLGEVVVKGTYDQPVILPPSDKTRVTLPLSLSPAGLAMLFKRFMDSSGEDIEMILRAVLTFDTALGPIEMNVEEKKVVSLNN